MTKTSHGIALAFLMSTALTGSALADQYGPITLKPGTAPANFSPAPGTTFVTVGCAQISEPVPPVCYVQRTTDVNGYGQFALVQPSGDGIDVVYQDQYSYSNSSEEERGLKKMIAKIQAYKGRLCNSEISPVCSVKTTLDANSHPTFSIVQRYRNFETGAGTAVAVYRHHVNSASASETERGLKYTIDKLTELQDDGLCAKPQAAQPAYTAPNTGAVSPSKTAAK